MFQRVTKKIAPRNQRGLLYVLLASLCFSLFLPAAGNLAANSDLISLLSSLSISSDSAMLGANMFAAGLMLTGLVNVTPTHWHKQRYGTHPGYGLLMLVGAVLLVSASAAPGMTAILAGYGLGLLAGGVGDQLSADVKAAKRNDRAALALEESSPQQASQQDMAPSATKRASTTNMLTNFAAKTSGVDSEVSASPFSGSRDNALTEIRVDSATASTAYLPASLELQDDFDRPSQAPYYRL